MYIAPEIKEDLKKYITDTFNKKKDENGRIALIDSFHIGGYMCEPERIENVVFPIIDKYFEEKEKLVKITTSFSSLANIEG